MEPIEKNQTISQKSQQIETINPNPALWDQFYQKFSPQEKKMFLQNQTYLLGNLIAQSLRKMQKSLRKLRENNH